MSTKASTIEFILDQLSDLPDVSARKMFGEYALYCGGKVVALVCDDQLFVKVTEPGKAFIADRYEEGFAYPGAKPSMRIDGDLIEDRRWISDLIRTTSENLPEPKKKPPRSGKSRRSGK
jgi:TfoX/Sxy family transcriptional regulator of competence genes